MTEILQEITFSNSIACNVVTEKFTRTIEPFELKRLIFWYKHLKVCRVFCILYRERFKCITQLFR